jgi:hypothetical protein
MSSILFIHSHANDGEVSLSLHDDQVRLNCRWPFDLESNDYVSIKNIYRATDYVEAVRAALGGKKARAEGIKGGFLEISPRQTGFDLEFSNAAEGFLKKTLQLRLDGQIKDLRGALDG